MGKLNQLVAVIEGGLKSRTTAAVTKLYQDLQSRDRFFGFTKTYRSFDDEGVVFPSERKLVEKSVTDLLDEIATRQMKLMNAVAQRDIANMGAVADVEVQGQTVLTHVPVTYLLYVAKQLQDLRTIISKVPTLDPAETWTLDPQLGLYRTEGTKAIKTQKIPTVLVRSEATDKFPAQTEVFMKDEPIGEWTNVRFSGAIPETEKRAMLDRVDQVAEGVRNAIEEANSIEVDTRQTWTDELFSYVLGRD